MAISIISCNQAEGFYQNRHKGITKIEFQSAIPTNDSFLNYNFLKIVAPNEEVFVSQRIDSEKTTQMIFTPSSTENLSKAFILLNKNPAQIIEDKEFKGVLFILRDLKSLNISYSEIVTNANLEVFNFSCTF